MPNKNMIIIRPATDKDAKAVLNVHFDAVNHLATKDYPIEIIKEWSSKVDKGRIRKYLENPDEEIRIVADQDGDIIGFGALVIEKNELRACYVASDRVRENIGSALVAELENIARHHNLEYLQLLSSLTAENFYNRNGYKSLERTPHTLRSGRKMDSVQMRKDLL